MEISELQEIIKKSGLSVYRIEKDLSIPNGTLSQVINGKKKLPEKYEEVLKSLVVEKPAVSVTPVIPVEPPFFDSREANASVIKEVSKIINGAPSAVIEQVPEPVEVKKKEVKKPDMEYANFIK